MADRDMTCPLDGMFSTRNAGELVAHEPAKSTFVRSGAIHVPGQADLRGDGGFSGLAQDAPPAGGQKLFGLPVWAVIAAAAVGAYCLAKK
jgi:hypothetical protein